MTSTEKLDLLERVIPQAIHADELRMIAREAIKVARETHDLHKLMNLVLQHHFESMRLRGFLRQALREWVRNTPNVEEVVVAFQIAREADLG